LEMWSEQIDEMII